MLSPKSYFEDLIAAQLQQFVHSIDKTQLSLGLWNGDVCLSNFTLKQQYIPLGCGVGIGLEFGKVDQLRIKVPWTQLQSGEVEVELDDVELVFRLRFDDEMSQRIAPAGEAHVDKMGKVDAAQRRQLHLPPIASAAQQSSWFNQTINSFLESYVATLIKGCVLNAKRVNATFLVPLNQNYSSHLNLESGGNDFAIFRISIDSIEVSTSLMKEAMFSSTHRAEHGESIVSRISKRCRSDGVSSSSAKGSMSGQSSPDDDMGSVPVGDSSKDAVLWSKGINVRGLMASLAKVQHITFKTHTDYEKLLPSKLKATQQSHHKHHSRHSHASSQSSERDTFRLFPYHIMLNPTHMFVHSSLCSTQEQFERDATPHVDSSGHPVTLPDTSSLLLDASLEINNIEITPSITELRLLRDVAKTAGAVQLRKKFEFYRPSVGVIGHATEWWTYVIMSAMTLVRESKRQVALECQAVPSPEKECSTEHFDIAHSGVLRKVYRNKYVKLYRAAVMLKFDAIFACVNDMAECSNPIAQTKQVGHLAANSILVLTMRKPIAEFLVEDQRLLIGDVERVLKASDIINCRSVIHKAISGAAGVSRDTMKMIVCGVIVDRLTLERLRDDTALVSAKADDVPDMAPLDEDLTVPPTPNMFSSMNSAASTPFVTSAPSGEFSPPKPPVSTDPADAVDAEVLALLKEFDSNEFGELQSPTLNSTPGGELSAPERKIYVHCEVSLARLSLSITEPLSAHYIKHHHTGCETMFNMVVYGLYGRHETLEGCEDETILRMGGIRVFGGRAMPPVGQEGTQASSGTHDPGSHIELLACGQNGSVTGMSEHVDATHSCAISIRVQSRHTVVEEMNFDTLKSLRKQNSNGVHRNSSRTVTRESSLGTNGVSESTGGKHKHDAPVDSHPPEKRRHIILETSISPVRFYWDQPTMLFLRNIVFAFVVALPAGTEITTPRFTKLRKMLAYSRSYANNSLGNVSTDKFSVDITLKGLSINIPHDSNTTEYVTIEADPVMPTQEEVITYETEAELSSIPSSDYGDSDSDSKDSDDDYDDIEFGRSNLSPRTTRRQEKKAEFLNFSKATDKVMHGGASKSSVWPETAPADTSAVREVIEHVVFPRRVFRKDVVEEPIIFQLQIGQVSLTSGDFLEHSMSVVRQRDAAVKLHNQQLLQQQQLLEQQQRDALNGTGHEDAPSRFETQEPLMLKTLSWEEESDLNILNAVEKLKSPLIRTLLCSVKHVTLQFVKRLSEAEILFAASSHHTATSSESLFRTVRYLSTTSWNIKALVSQSEQPFHPVDSDLRLDMFFSPLKMSMSTEDIISIINSIRSIDDIIKVPKALFPEEEGEYVVPVNKDVIPEEHLRFARFANLSELQVCALFDCISLCLVESTADVQNASALLVTGMFKTYASHLRSIAGNSTRVSKCYRRISGHRLCQMGLSKVQSDEALDTFTAQIQALLVTEASVGDAQCTEYVQGVVQSILTLLPGLDHLNTSRDIKKPDAYGPVDVKVSPDDELVSPGDKFRNAVTKTMGKTKAKAGANRHIGFRDLVKSIMRHDNRVLVASFELRDVSAHVVKLTYDTKVCVALKELRLSDQYRNPIFLMYKKASSSKTSTSSSSHNAHQTGRGSPTKAFNGNTPSPLKRSKSQFNSGMSSAQLQPDNSYLPHINSAEAVVHVTFMDRDHAHDFGVGNSFGISRRKQEIDVKVMHFESYLSRSGLPTIMEQVGPAIQRVNLHTIVTAYAYERHQQLLGSSTLIPQLGYESVFDVQSMDYIDIPSIAAHSKRVQQQLQTSNPASGRRSSVSPFKRASMRKSMSSPSPITKKRVAVPTEELEPIPIVFVSSSVQTVALVLADEGRLFSEIIMNNVSVSVRPGVAESALVENAMDTNITMDTIKVFDLTPMGSVHSQFIWSHNPSSSAAQANSGDTGSNTNASTRPSKREPAIAINIAAHEKFMGFVRASNKQLSNFGLTPAPVVVGRQPAPTRLHRESVLQASVKPQVVAAVAQESLVALSRDFSHVTVTCRGLNACFVFRFYQEMMLFVFRKMIDPVTAALANTVLTKGDVSEKVRDSNVLGLDDDKYHLWCQKNSSHANWRQRRRDRDLSDGSSDGSFYDDDESEYSDSNSDAYSDSDDDMYYRMRPVRQPDNFRTPIKGRGADEQTLFSFQSRPRSSTTDYQRTGSMRRRTAAGTGASRVSTHHRPDSPGSMELVAPRVRDVESKIDIFCHDTSGIVPRNSCNEDLIGLNVKHVHVTFYPVEESWKGVFEKKIVPTSNNGEEVIMHFDIKRNEWMFNNEAEAPTERKPSVTIDTLGLSVVSDESGDRSPSIAAVTAPASATTGSKMGTMSNLFGAVQDDADDMSTCEKSIHPFEEDLFYDAVSGPGSTPLPRNLSQTLTPLTNDSVGTNAGSTSSGQKTPTNFRSLEFSPPVKKLTDYPKYVPVKTPEDSPYLRHSIELKEVSIFVCLHNPIDVGPGAEEQEHVSVDDKKFARVRAMYPVYVNPAHAGGRHRKHHHRSPLVGAENGQLANSAMGRMLQMKWRPVTVAPFDLALVLDLDPKTDIMRTLVSDCSTYTPLMLKLSMAELYLLMSIYFDGICELQQFFPEEQSVPSPTKKDDTPPSIQALPEYGSPAYLEYLRNRPTLNEGGFVMICAKLSVDLSLDINYFPNNLFSLPFLLRNNTDKELVNLISASLNYTSKAERQANWNYQSLPICNLTVERWALQAMNDPEVSQTGLGAYSVTITDLRSPAQTCQPVIIKAAPVPVLNTEGDDIAEEFYGYIDFDFGLHINPSCLRTGQPLLDIPLQLTTYSSARSNWTTTNVGIDYVDINLFNLDFIWLLADLFASYFSLPEFGNPTAAAYHDLPNQSIEHPYGGADTRVFATRPHIAVMDNPMQLSCQSLHLETDYGIYYRNSIDSNGSTNTEVQLTDIALVLLNQYKQPSLARGLRGAAGSGSGIRTQVEFLSGSIIHHYDAMLNNFDLLVDIVPIERTDDKHAKAPKEVTKTGKHFVHYEAEYPVIESKAQFEPMCVFPLASSSQAFPKNACAVVTSYEDLLFTIGLVMKLIDFTPPKPLPPVVHMFENHASRRRSANMTPGKDSEARSKIDPVSKLMLASQFSVIRLRALRFIVVDNVLGLHLPLLQLYVDELNINSNRQLVEKKKKEQVPGRSRLGLTSTPSRRSFTQKMNSEDHTNPASGPTSPTEKPVFESIVYAQVRTWAEYFNNVLKCWECLVEPLYPVILIEDSPERGAGYILRLISNVHVNLTGALLRSVNDILRMVKSSNENIQNRKQSNADGGGSVPAGAPGAVEFTDPIEHMDGLPSSSGLESMPSQSSDNGSIVSRGGKPGLRRRASGTVQMEPSVKLDYRPGVVLQHLPFHTLSDDTRVGFSILNLTGQSVRYLQTGGGGRLVLQYIGHGQRGALNFVPSTTLIRNNQVLEEEFGVQRVRESDAVAAGARKVIRTGHQVALQVSGYKWLEKVQADMLGSRCEAITPIIGRVNLSAAFNEQNDRSRRILKATMLVTEVRPYDGGRLLTLKSTFCIQNNTSHSLKVLTRSGEKPKLHTTKNSSSYGSVASGEEEDGQVFLLQSGDNFNVPLSFLQSSALLSGARSLGNVYIKPSDITPVKNELLGKIKLYPDKVSYTIEPIDLLDTLTRSEAEVDRIVNGDNSNADPVLQETSPQLCCQVAPKRRQQQKAGASEEENTSIVSGRLPPFCYTIEIRRMTAGNVGAFEESAQGSMAAGKSKIKEMASNIADKLPFNFFNRDRAQAVTGDPASYVIIVHPPIILENLLSCGGKFTLMHPIHEVVLWSGWIGAGMVQAVHSVTLEEPLLLLINLKYCRSTEGILVHKPANMSHESHAGIAIAAAVKSAFEGFLDDDESTDASFFLTDAHGQRLRLHIQNTLGGGGQRHIAVYCPYWIVNTSQYAVRIREENDIALPAGTITPQKNGTIPVSDADNERSGRHFHTIRDTANPNEHEIGESTVFPGQQNQLHASQNNEIKEDSELLRLLKSFSFEEITDMAYLFNYKDDVRVIGGKRTVRIQMDDSVWSLPFSLDTAGVSQSVVIDGDAGTLEVGVRVEYAPGKLSKLTKIVRLVPKFVVFNQLPQSIELEQAAGVGAGVTKSVSVSSGYVKPFHLPAVYGERVVRLKVDGEWKKSVPFAIDHIGSYTLNIPRKLDLNSLKHVKTRGAAEYTVHLPSTEDAKEIGIWFETDWTKTDIVVKACKPGLFAATQTEIEIGDVILSVGGVSVDDIRFGKLYPTDKDLRFEKIMELLKELRSKSSKDERGLDILDENGGKIVPGVDVTFRTVEEKMRLVRANSLDRRSRPTQAQTKPSARAAAVDPNHQVDSPEEELYDEANDPNAQKSMEIKVDLRVVESAVFLHLSIADPLIRADYRIENSSASHVIHYKQRGVPGIRWAELHPGKADNYVWEDPFEPHELVVRTGRNILDPSDGGSMHTALATWNNAESLRTNFHSFVLKATSDPYVQVMNFDELNKPEMLPIPGKDEKLQMKVVSDGPTKVLCITPMQDHARRENMFTAKVLEEQVLVLRQHQQTIEQLCDVLKRSAPVDGMDIPSSEDELFGNVPAPVEELPDFITPEVDADASEGPAGSLAASASSSQSVVPKRKITTRKSVVRIGQGATVSSLGIALKMVLKDLRARMESCKVEFSMPPAVLQSPTRERAGSSSENPPIGGGRRFGRVALAAKDMVGAAATDIVNTAANILHSSADTLTSYCDIQSPLGLIVNDKHRLLVDVLEARELRSSRRIKGDRVHDVFCKMYLKTPDDIYLKTGTRQHKLTYISDRTMDPLWVGQKFVFDVPEKASFQNRGYFIRIVVRSASAFGQTRFMGQADIPFSGLQSQEPLDGWFPLRGKASSQTRIQAVELGDESYGSIKLRLQWIHSDIGLANHIHSQMIRRIGQLDEHLDVNRSHLLKSVPEEMPNKRASLFAFQSGSTTSIGDGSAGGEEEHPLKLDFIGPARRPSHDASGHVRNHSRDRLSLVRGVGGPVAEHSPLRMLEEDDIVVRVPNRRSLTRRSTAIDGKKQWATDLATSTPVRVTASHRASSLSTINVNDEADSLGGKVDGIVVPLPKPRTLHPENVKKWARGIHAEALRLPADSLNNALITEVPSRDDNSHHREPSDTSAPSNTPLSTPIPKTKPLVLRRKAATDADNKKFLKHSTNECKRNFAHVHSQVGELEITPVKALQLPVTQNKVHVRIMYGEVMAETASVDPAADLNFVPPEDLLGNNGLFAVSNNTTGSTTAAAGVSSPGGEETKAPTNTVTKKFLMDLVNVRGSLKFKIISENFPKYKEIAQLEIPVFNLLDTLLDVNGDGVYDRWFPMLKSSECVPSEGLQDNFRTDLQSEKLSDGVSSPYGFKPCIRLHFRWRPTTQVPTQCNFYFRLQLPELSVGVVDSVQSREVMQVCVSDVTLRQFITTDVTSTSANVGFLQIDNQLPNPMASVILYPTQTKHPQPAVRFHLSKSNLNSQPHLNSYEAIQVIIQEFDLKLEQQTVVATWELVQDWTQELRYTFELLETSDPNNTMKKPARATEVRSDASVDTSSQQGFGGGDSRYHHSGDNENEELLKWYGMSYTPQNHVTAAVVEGSTATTVQKKDDEHSVDKIYIEFFKLGPIQVNVGFIMTPHMDANIDITGNIAAGNVGLNPHKLAQQKDGNGADDEKGDLSTAAWNFLLQVGEVVLDLTSAVDNAPIMLNGLEVPNLFETEAKLGTILQDHYFTSALRQLYKIVGSLELVGNPIGLMSSLGVGVKDFFYEPAVAVINSPTELGKFGKSVFKGTLSLMTNTADGMIGTGTTFTRAAGRGMAKLTMDNAFMNSRLELQRVPNDAVLMMIRPLKDLRNGFYYGIVGILRVPYTNIRRYGVSGIIPGIAKGIAGVATKPVVGVLDAATHMGEGFREGMKYLTRESTVPITRRRLTNLFGPDGRILPYSYTTALGRHVLLVLDQIARERFNSGINEGVGMLKYGLSMVSTKNPAAMQDNRRSTHAAMEEGRARRGSKTIRSSIGKPNLGGGFDDGNDIDEFVIYTAVLPKGVNTDQVVIVSTQRVLVAEHKRERSSYTMKQIWQSPLSDITTPVLEQNGGGATLRVCTGTINGVVDKVTASPEPRRSFFGGDSKERLGSLAEQYHRRPSIAVNSSIGGGLKLNNNDFTIVSAYQEENILVQLCNCLNLMKHNFNNIIPFASIGDEEHSATTAIRDLEEDESTGVVRIGPWEYTRDVTAGIDLSNNIAELNDPRILEILQNLEWVVQSAPHIVGGDISNQPRWLLDNCIEAEEAHQVIGELNDLCGDAQLELMDGYRNIVNALLKGKSSYSDFKVQYEMQKAFFAENELERVRLRSIHSKPVDKGEDDDSVTSLHSKGTTFKSKLSTYPTKFINEAVDIISKFGDKEKTKKDKGSKSKVKVEGDKNASDPNSVPMAAGALNSVDSNSSSFISARAASKVRAVGSVDSKKNVTSSSGDVDEHSPLFMDARESRVGSMDGESVDKSDNKITQLTSWFKLSGARSPLGRQNRDEGDEKSTGGDSGEYVIGRRRVASSGDFSGNLGISPIASSLTVSRVDEPESDLGASSGVTVVSDTSTDYQENAPVRRRLPPRGPVPRQFSNMPASSGPGSGGASTGRSALMSISNLADDLDKQDPAYELVLARLAKLESMLSTTTDPRSEGGSVNTHTQLQSRSGAGAGAGAEESPIQPHTPVSDHGQTPLSALSNDSPQDASNISDSTGVGITNTTDSPGLDSQPSAVRSSSTSPDMVVSSKTTSTTSPVVVPSVSDQMRDTSRRRRPVLDPIPGLDPTLLAPPAAPVRIDDDDDDVSITTTGNIR